MNVGKKEGWFNSLILGITKKNIQEIISLNNHFAFLFFIITNVTFATFSTILILYLYFHPKIKENNIIQKTTQKKKTHKTHM